MTEPEPVNPELIDPGLTPLVDQAITDLALHLKVAPEAISVESARLTTWTDRGFLGPDVEELRQTQVPVDGCEIVLRSGSQDDPSRYRYRTGGTVYRPRRYIEDQPEL